MDTRLQKILAQLGVASRRQAEEMIKHERVRINGVLAQLGQKVDPHRDEIRVDGKLVSTVERPSLIYLLLNKPKGVVSTCKDPQGRPTVLDLLPKELSFGQGIHPVGRLDVDTTGALILTNDGDLTFGLTHPRHSIPKTYRVLVVGNPPEAVLKKWRQGVMLEERPTLPAQVKVIQKFASSVCLEIILKEGRNRQIRRVAEQLGYPVIKLHRVSIGPIKLQLSQGGNLSSGKYRHLEEYELHFLHRQLKEL